MYNYVKICPDETTIHIGRNDYIPDEVTTFCGRSEGRDDQRTK